MLELLQLKNVCNSSVCTRMLSAVCALYSASNCSISWMSLLYNTTKTWYMHRYVYDCCKVLFCINNGKSSSVAEKAAQYCTSRIFAVDSRGCTSLPAVPRQIWPSPRYGTKMNSDILPNPAPNFYRDWKSPKFGLNFQPQCAIVTCNWHLLTYLLWRTLASKRNNTLEICKTSTWRADECPSTWLRYFANPCPNFYREG